MKKYTDLPNLTVLWYFLAHQTESVKNASDGEVIAGSLLGDIKTLLDKVDKELDYVEFKQSRKYINTMREKMSKGDYKCGDYKRDAHIIQERVDHELEDIMLGFIPANLAPYFPE